MREEPVHGAVVEGFAPGVDHGLQEEVRLLELVVEEAVVLAELEVAEVEALDGRCAKHIETREEPAAAGGFLVGAAHCLYFVGEVGVDHHRTVCIPGEGGQGRGVHCIAEGLVGGSAFIAFADFTQDVGVKTALLGKCADAQQRHCEYKYLLHIQLVIIFVQILCKLGGNHRTAASDHAAAGFRCGIGTLAGGAEFL